MKCHRTLGVLGGMGPAATSEFLRLLAAYAPAVCDQEHPAILMWSDPTIPDRSAAMLGKGPSPEAYLRQGFEKLVSGGADVLCAPCNSAHYFINHFREELAKPLVHIVEETLLCAMTNFPQGAWLLGTQGTLQTGLYQAEALHRGYSLYVPEEEIREVVEESLRDIKANRFVQAGEKLVQVVQCLHMVREVPLVLACTELPLAYAAAGLPEMEAVSSLEALARGCIQALYGQST